VGWTSTSPPGIEREVAVSVNAGAAVVYSTRALDAFDAAAELNTPTTGETS
jgi:hypothetical protein